jgi:glucosamine--fructose-6-phosphate aminotransferase (isomerizing)
MWMDQQEEDWITNADKRIRIIQEIKGINVGVVGALGSDLLIKKIAEKYKSYEKFLFIGRQYNYPVALEGALKMKELCYNYAEGFAAAELKHGPLALVDKKTVAVVINNDQRQQIKMGSTMEEIKSRGGKIINIDYRKKSKDIELISPSEIVDDNIVVPSVCSCLSPMVSVITLQLFAYHSAIARGKNVDRPRNLAKSVTVE